MAVARRVVAIVIGIALWTSHLSAAESLEPRNRKMAPTVWPVGKRFVRLGPHGKPNDFRWIDAPPEAVEAAKALLKGEKSSWSINKINDYDFEGPGKTVVSIRDRQNNFFICLVEKKRWIRLNERRGLPFIDEIVGNERGRPKDNKVEKTVRYVESVAFLYKGSQRVVLTRNIREVVKGCWDLWNKGWEKNFRAFAALCFDPIVTRNGENDQIIVNIVTDRGAVERWTLTVRGTDRIHLRDVNVKTLTPPGTFSYAF